MQHFATIVLLVFGLTAANAQLLSGVTKTVGSTVNNLLGGTSATVGVGGTSATVKVGTGSAAAE